MSILSGFLPIYYQFFAVVDIILFLFIHWFIHHLILSFKKKFQNRLEFIENLKFADFLLKHRKHAVGKNSSMNLPSLYMFLFEFAFLTEVHPK